MIHDKIILFDAALLAQKTRCGRVTLNEVLNNYGLIEMDQNQMLSNILQNGVILDWLDIKNYFQISTVSSRTLQLGYEIPENVLKWSPS